ncbi:MAG: sodium:calcium antiporter [Chloroflexi bacterium]|nr:sodium:calcium antiporter [Chloroflexota bacterium]
MAHAAELSSSERPVGRDYVFMAAAVAVTLPWIVLRFQNYHGNPAIIAALAGLAIVGAAFMLSWAAEAFEKDVSQALALALLALIAVLPEYAVDMVFAWKAAEDPSQAQFAVANMTGANRLLIGIGWSAIVLVAWLRFRAQRVSLERGQAIEIAILLTATLYSFTIPLRSSLPLPAWLHGISLLDTAVFVVLFGLYTWAAAKAESHEPELVGPARIVGSLSTRGRRTGTLALFLFAAFVIFVSAEPFAEGLVETGAAFNIDQFLLVQWLAPLASESPEFLIAILFAWKGNAAAGMRAMVSSKVNQWTLLIGTLALVYGIAKGRPDALPLDSHQAVELFLTSAQSLFAVVLILALVLDWKGAIALFVLFFLQLVAPWDGAHLWFAFAYIGLALAIVLADGRRRAALIGLPLETRLALRGSPAAADLADEGTPSPSPAHPGRHRHSLPS